MGYRVTRLPGVIDDKSSGGKRLDHVLFVSSTAPDADHPTIAVAITAASAGDTILLDSEEFTETLTVNKSLTIAGISPGDTAITHTGTSGSAITVSANDVTLVNLTINRSGASGSGIPAVYGNAITGFTMRNCVVNYTGTNNNVALYGISHNGSTGWILDNVRVTNSVSSTQTSTYGLYLGAAGDIKIIGGSYDGVDADIYLNHANASVELAEPWLVNDDLNVAAGSWQGAYYQGSDGLWIPQKFVGARVFNSSGTTLSNNVTTVLLFDSERWDTDTIHSTISNTSRLTATTEGYYYIFASAVFAASAVGFRQIGIRLNGTTLVALIQTFNSGGARIALDTSTVYFLSASDYVEMVVLQNSGGNLTVDVLANVSPEFAMHRFAQ